jgi:hypothetical protein
MPPCLPPQTAVRKLAAEVGDAAQLCEALSSALRQYPTPSRHAQVGPATQKGGWVGLLGGWVVR